jgi:hypothetical protein
MTTRKRRDSIGQTIGGVLFGFEQQVLRTTPPPQELVHHARPDLPVAAGDGTLVMISLPGDDEAARASAPGSRTTEPEAQDEGDPDGR